MKLTAGYLHNLYGLIAPVWIDASEAGDWMIQATEDLGDHYVMEHRGTQYRTVELCPIIITDARIERLFDNFRYE